MHLKATVRSITDNTVAIIIPTKNRSNKLTELLRYYEEIKCQHKIYIGDASDSCHINEIIPVIKSLSKNINIVHKQYPEYGRSGVDVANTVVKMLEFVEEEYVVFSGDDDYFIPKSLDKCVDFLENNPDYSSAHGYGTFIIDDESDGKAKISGRYIVNDYKADLAYERFKMFSNHFSVLYFSVHRTIIFRKAYKNIEKLPIYPTLFEEVMPAFMCAILGNSKKLDCLYIIRNISPIRYKQGKIVEKIIDSGWSNAVDTFINTLSQELRTLDGIEETDAKEIVKQGLVEYLERAMIEYYSKNDTASPEHINRRVLNRIKNRIPVCVKYFIRKSMLLITHDNSLYDSCYYNASGQLSKSSPYYNELKSLLLVLNRILDH